MEIEMVGTKTRKHCDRDLAETLIAAGLAVEIKPLGWNKTKPQPNTRFAAKMPNEIGDYRPPPGIMFTTTCCGNSGVCESQRGTAHITLVVRHCGVTEKVPADAAAEYLRLFNTWKARSRKPQAPKISAADSRFVHQFGMKTKEEIITEAQANLILAGKK